MKNWQQFLFQLVVTLIVPLLVPGSVIGLLFLLKEQLPQLLYNILLWLLWLLIVVIIVRFVFGDTISQGVRYIKRYIERKKKDKLIRDWYNKFGRLADIVSIIATETGWNNPTDEQSREYRRLQHWFRNNRAKFIPTWRFFFRNRPDSAYQPHSTASLEYQIIYDKEDPFSCFYDPMTLDRLGEMMRHEFGDKDGDRVRYVLTRLRELNAECIEWEKSRR